MLLGGLLDVDQSWLPLPTHPQRYCDPVSLVIIIIFPIFSRLQCPILDKDDGEWSKLSDERKAELRKEHHLTIEDEYWREDEDGVRPDEPSQIFVDHPPCTINGMGVLVLW